MFQTFQKLKVCVHNKYKKKCLVLIDYQRLMILNHFSLENIPHENLVIGKTYLFINHGSIFYEYCVIIKY